MEREETGSDDGEGDKSAGMSIARQSETRSSLPWLNRSTGTLHRAVKESDWRAAGRSMPAAEALAAAGLAPVELAAKEGLALINGTAQEEE